MLANIGQLTGLAGQHKLLISDSCAINNPHAKALTALCSMEGLHMAEVPAA